MAYGQQFMKPSVSEQQHGDPALHIHTQITPNKCLLSNRCQECVDTDSAADARLVSSEDCRGQFYSVAFVVEMV